MGILVGKYLEVSRSLWVYENLEGSGSFIGIRSKWVKRIPVYRIERERDNIYILLYLD